MKRITLFAFATALLITACNNDTKTGETDKPSDTTKSADSGTATVVSDETPQPYTMPDSATMMKNWMAYATPGEPQKMMASWAGTWDGESTMWMDPKAPPMVSKVKAVNRMILGGRYMESVNTGDMMGQPFEGRSTMGYDNFKKEFISTWVDNMGTGVMVMKGTWDEATKSLTLKGKMTNACTTDGKDTWVREVYKVIDENNHVMEMYGYGPDAKEFKTMEIKMTRKK